MADSTPTGVGSVPVPTGGGGGYPKFVDLGNGYTIVYSDAYDAGSIVSTKNVGGAADGGLSQNTVYSQQQQNARDQASLAEQQRQFDLTQGERKARGDQQMRLDQATLANAQTPAERAALLAEQQRQFNSTQGLDYYKYLANQAANPRNFVENFILRRGGSAPANAGMYGNNDAALRQFSGFAPQGAGAAAPSAAYPTGPLSTPPTATGGGYASPYEGLSGFSQTGPPNRLSPNDPDAARLLALHPDQYQMTSPEQAAKYLPKFAQGGSVTLNEPHALVNLRTGQPVAIAGEAGVEHVNFDGNVITDPAGSGYDPYGGGYMPGYEPGAGVGYAGTTTQPTGSQYMPGYEPDPYSPPPVPSGSVPLQTGAVAPTPGWTPAQLQQMIASANAGNVRPTQTQSTTPTTGGLPNIPGLIAEPIQPNYPGIGPPTGGIGPTVRDTSPAGTFGGISGSGGIPGARPAFLAGEGQSTLAQLTAAGTVPPFLQRSLAQARGDQSQGTNQPIPNELPKDVPLLSRLAWDQLNPDEQQAYLSYASSYGVTPEEYVAAINANAPQGGVTPWSNFGTNFQFSRQ